MGTTVYDLSCMPCCTPECCECADLPATIDVTDGSDTWTLTKDCGAYPSGGFAISSILDMFCGQQIIDISVTCTDGEWTLTASPNDAMADPIVVPLSWDGDCDPLVLTGSVDGCSITVS